MILSVTADVGHGHDRRLLLKAALGSSALVGAFAGASRLGLLSDDEAQLSRPGLQLSSDNGSDIAAVEVPLGDDYLPSTGRREWRSRALPTSTHSMVGFTWRLGAQEPRIHIRSRRGGRWGPWQHVPLLHDLPDPGTGEVSDRMGTQVLWIGPADGIQVRVGTSRPDGLTLVLLHPARRARDGVAFDTRARTIGPAARGTTQATAQPAMKTRIDWGADESLRNGDSRYNETLEQIHVHHTANSNDYGEADVAALIRGMYRYHTQNLGWSDLAYNFVVDRFGGIWIGRAGGSRRLVRGAHTLGFNATSTGIAVIGNLDMVTPTNETIEAICQLAAWKLSPYDRVPDGTTGVVSQGSDKYRSGTVATLPVIDGHRDTNDTSCPGSNLYAALPAIRVRTAAIVAAAQLRPMAITAPPALTGRPVLGRTISVAPGVTEPGDALPTYAWLRNEAGITGATGSSYVPVVEDVGTQLSVRVTHTRTGYLDTVQDLSALGLTLAPSMMILRALGRVGRAVIRVDVTPVGLTATASGVVRVRVNQRKKTVALTNGRATARFLIVSKGRYEVSAKYLGDSMLRPTRKTTTVRVR